MAREFWTGLLAADGPDPACVDQVQALDVAWLRAQGLAPYISYRLREAGLLAQLPEAEQAALKSAFYSAKVHSTLLTMELKALLEALQPLGIEPILLKGMALGSTLYPSPATRPTSDLDVLIEPAQLETVQQVLTARGYQGMGFAPGHQPLNNHWHAWREPGNGQSVAVEAHWHLVHDQGYARRMDLRGFYSRAQWADVQGCPARMLAPADQLIHACAHLLLHHARSFSLLWLLDLRLLVGRYGQSWDWGELVGRAAEYRLAGALRYWLELTEMWYGPFLPAQAVAALAAARVTSEERFYLSRAVGGHAQVWEYVWQRTFGAAGLRQRLGYVRDLFFPSWAFMQYRYGARSRWLAPLYYGCRFVRAGLVAFRRVGSG